MSVYKCICGWYETDHELRDREGIGRGGAKKCRGSGTLSSPPPRDGVKPFHPLSEWLKLITVITISELPTACFLCPI